VKIIDSGPADASKSEQPAQKQEEDSIGGEGSLRPRWQLARDDYGEDDDETNQNKTTRKHN
jgi:hypothetical protein